MFEYIGWDEVKERIETGIESAIRDKVVTYDLARQMEGARGEMLRVRGRDHRRMVRNGAGADTKRCSSSMKQ